MEEELRNPELGVNPLTSLLRARQRSERFKVPLLTTMTQELLYEEKSVVLFVSFKESFDQIYDNLSRIIPCSRIVGGQKVEVRDEEIRKFQADETRVAVVMIQAGGVGLSLHDLHGRHPRVSLITPTFNATELKQALGRIHRAGGLTKSLQRVIYAAGTVEEQACKAVKRKLANLSLLNDGDLQEGINYG